MADNYCRCSICGYLWTEGDLECNSGCPTHGRNVEYLDKEEWFELWEKRKEKGEKHANE